MSAEGDAKYRESRGGPRVRAKTEYRYEKGLSRVNGLAKEGWRVVQVIGAQKTDLGGEDRTLFLLERAAVSTETT